MARLSTTTQTNALNGAFPSASTYYLALYTTDPGTTGASGEVTGGSYARQSFTFATAVSGSQASNSVVNFVGMPAEASGVPYFGIWSAATGGTYIAGGATSGLSSAISAGATISFASGAITNTIS